jgi:hypothetical protein
MFYKDEDNFFIGKGSTYANKIKKVILISDLFVFMSIVMLALWIIFTGGSIGTFFIDFRIFILLCIF